MLFFLEGLCLPYLLDSVHETGSAIPFPVEREGLQRFIFWQLPLSLSSCLCVSVSSPACQLIEGWGSPFFYVAYLLAQGQVFGR